MKFSVNGRDGEVKKDSCNTLGFSSQKDNQLAINVLNNNNNNSVTGKFRK